ncbi:MAG: DnaJ C terminal domain-containing protein, partial [Olpidium bornovanus]
GTGLQTLSDETKRAIFDGSRSGGGPNAAPSGFGYAGDAFGGGFSRYSGYGDFDAYMDEEEMYNIFEGRRRGNGAWRRRGGKGTDVRISVQVEFLDAIHGKTVTVDVPRTSMCAACKGEGARFGAKRKECVRCDGTGTISRTYGSMLMNTPCTKCNGSGQRISREDRCAVCNGSGEIDGVTATEIKIPPGSSEGQRPAKISAAQLLKTVLSNRTTDETEIRIPGEGNRAPGHNGQPGDLRVMITVRSSDVFRRKGYDIHVSTEVPLPTAVLGGYVRVPTLDGDVDMKVRPGAQSGQIAVLRDRGIKKSRSARGYARGQQYVTINVTLPA